MAWHTLVDCCSSEQSLTGGYPPIATREGSQQPKLSSQMPTSSLVAATQLPACLGVHRAAQPDLGQPVHAAGHMYPLVNSMAAT
jgi:hypothetical protein